MSDSYPLIGKLYYKIPIKLQSPIIIGSGDDENSDVDVIRDNSGNPVIPATSIVGVVRHYAELLENSENEESLKFLFGFQERDTSDKKGNKDDRMKQFQSALMCDDIVLEVSKIKVRDSVAIDGATGTAKNQSKFDYEIVETLNKEIVCCFEINIRDGYDKEIFKKIMESIIWAMANDRIRLGAKTTKGFGRIEVVNKKYRMADLDFTNKDHFTQWLVNTPIYQNSLIESPPFHSVQKRFKITADFTMKGPLLIRSGEEPQENNISKAPDAVQLTCNGKPVLPGTSLRGAIRHRAEKIFRIFDDNGADSESFKDLFGDVPIDNINSDKKARKSKVYIEETYIDNSAITKEIQSRIKIDRFTGGVMSGALFQIMPIWPLSDNQLHVEMTIDKFEEWEAGLLLLVFKDLCSGDLAVGGETSIGRGIFTVKSAEITVTQDGKDVIFNPQFNEQGEFKPDSVKDLDEKYVQAFVGRFKNGK